MDLQQKLSDRLLCKVCWEHDVAMVKLNILLSAAALPCSDVTLNASLTIKGLVRRYSFRAGTRVHAGLAGRR